MEGSLNFHSKIKDGLLEAIHDQYVKMIQVSPTVLYWMLVKDWTEWEGDIPLLRLRGRIEPLFDELEKEWADYKGKKRSIAISPTELHEILLGTFYMAVMSDIMNHPVGFKDREYFKRIMDATGQVVVRNNI